MGTFCATLRRGRRAGGADGGGFVARVVRGVGRRSLDGLTTGSKARQPGRQQRRRRASVALPTLLARLLAHHGRGRSGGA